MSLLGLANFGVETGQSMQNRRTVLGKLRGFDGLLNVVILNLAGKERVPRIIVEQAGILFALVDQLLHQAARSREVAAVGFNLHLRQQHILISIQQLQPFVA